MSLDSAQEQYDQQSAEPRVGNLYNRGFDFGFENPDMRNPPDGSCCPGSYLEGLRDGRTERLACEELIEAKRNNNGDE